MTRPNIPRRHVLLSTLALGTGLPSLAQQGPWPNRPIKMIVAGTPGAGGDIFARLIATPLQNILKQTPTWWSRGELQRPLMEAMAEALASVGGLTRPIDWNAAIQPGFEPSPRTQ